MYSVLCDGEVIYSPAFTSIGCIATSAKLNMELNRASTLTITLPPEAVGYDKIKKLSSLITVMDDLTKVFHGRCVDYSEDFYKNRTYTCEGELAYLNDSILRPYSYNKSPGDIFKSYIESHNNRVNSNRQFQVGDISEMQDDQIVRESEQYPTTMNELQEKLIDNYGGYVMTRYVGDDIYLDYKRTSGTANSQIIKFGSNLLELTRFIDASEVCTVLIPLGGDDGQGNPITITSVNGGRDYVQSDTAVAMFGRIEVCETWDDVNTASLLLQRANARIGQIISESVTLDIKAVDLSLINVDAERLRLGQYNRVISVAHDIDNFFQCSKISLDMTNPSRNEYTFGNPRKTLSEQVSKLRGYAYGLAR